VDLEDIILIGGIEDKRENMCKLVHHALSFDFRSEQEARPSKSPEPPRKKKKTIETTVVRKSFN